jgi:lysophospholipase L1-like esterase
MNLVFIGDSLTEWHDWQKRFPGHRVLNLGISGETVEELFARLDNIRGTVKDPDAVFLMTGINNVLMERYDIGITYRKIIENFVTWWKGTRIVVQSLLPVEVPWIGNDLIRDINVGLEDVARECGVVYLDLFTAFIDAQGNPKNGFLSDDGVHLAIKGYEAWSKAVERFLRLS